MVKMVIFEKWQKVFDNGLDQQMIPKCHETPQGEMKHINRSFHQFGAYLGKVANATFVNPRNEQKWIFQDLVIQIYSP